MSSLVKAKKIKRSFMYILLNFTKLIGFFYTSGLKKIKPFSFLSWHHGFMYFLAENEMGDKLFIKMDTEVLCVFNEVKICDFLKNSSVIDTPSILYSKDYKGLHSVVFRYVEGKPIQYEDLLSEPSLIIDLYKILVEFTQLGLCHRDIKLDNFMRNGEGVIFIDFTYTEQLSVRGGGLKLTHAPKEIEKDLGFHCSYFEWNDYFSFYEIIKKVIDEIDSKHPDYEKLSDIYIDCNMRKEQHSYTYKSLYL